MLCVEAGHVSTPVILLPGTAFEASQILQVNNDSFCLVFFPVRLKPFNCIRMHNGFIHLVFCVSSQENLLFHFCFVPEYFVLFIFFPFVCLFYVVFVAN